MKVHGSVDNCPRHVKEYRSVPFGLLLGARAERLVRLIISSTIGGFGSPAELVIV